jgi:hypothetical protein
MNSKIAVNSCYHPETRVRMANGTNKYIRDIEIGDVICGDNNEFRTVIGKRTGSDQLYFVKQSKGVDYMVALDNTLVLRATGVTPYVTTSWETNFRICYYVKCTGGTCKKDTCSKKGFKKKQFSYPTRERAEEALNELIAGTLDPYYVYDGEIFEMTVREFNNLCYSDVKNTRLKGYKAIPKIIDHNASFPIDPYLLGLWLGDGNVGDPMITSADKEIEDYLYQYLKKYNGSMSIKKETTLAGSISSTGIIANIEYSRYRFVWNVHGKNPIRKSLKDLGILWDKHIPVIYLNSSVENRMQLLAGLLDTDGCLSYKIARNKSGGTWIYRFVQAEMRKTLIDQIQEMCKCLGFTDCGIYTRKYSPINREIFRDGKEFHNSYELTISGPMILKVPCLIQRKKAYIHCADQRFFVSNTSKIKINQLDQNEYIGLSIDGNQRFLLEDLTVVHC